jgi:uncharacterized phage protein (TIGR01671 family)
MREIKFRGKAVYNGEWVYGTPVLDYPFSHMLNVVPDSIKKGTTIASMISTLIDKETIGQFTGLKDKDGKDIYEGDVISVRYNEDTTHNSVVEFDRSSWVSNYYILSALIHEATVVGNIHDNPELLGGAQ